MRFFGKKIRKFLTLEKIENMMNECFTFFPRKKRFHLFKTFLYKNGKAQDMPVVAGRLVKKIKLSCVFTNDVFWPP